MRFVKASLTLAALTLTLLPATAPAAPASVAFTGTVTVSHEPKGLGSSRGITNTGTWTATGAVTDSFAVTEQTWFGSGSVHYVGTLTGTKGAITVDVQGKFVGFDGTFEHVQGIWTITSGTGQYANLHGTGDYTAKVNETTQPPIVTELLIGTAGND